VVFFRPAPLATLTANVKNNRRTDAKKNALITFRRASFRPRERKSAVWLRFRVHIQQLSHPRLCKLNNIWGGARTRYPVLIKHTEIRAIVRNSRLAGRRAPNVGVRVCICVYTCCWHSEERLGRSQNVCQRIGNGTTQIAHPSKNHKRKSITPHQTKTSKVYYAKRREHMNENVYNDNEFTPGCAGSERCSASGLRRGNRSSRERGLRRGYQG